MTDERVQLGHGSGGRLTHELIERLLLRHLDSPLLAPLGDAALLDAGPVRLALTTDSFVVSPLFFAGGDIGSLAVNGTVNDLAVSGARPRWLSLGLILEEGLPMETLERVVRSIARAAEAAGVQVVTGDTKVVERGKGDGLFINTAGVGLARPGYPGGVRAAGPGDALLVSGPLGDHGAVILAARSGVELSGPLVSDCAPVIDLVDALFEAGVTPLFMRDPTRGGLAGVACDVAEQLRLGLVLDEAEIPLGPDVATLCDLLGTDPLHLACEGRVVALVGAGDAARALAAWRGLPAGAGARRVGALEGRRPGQVVLNTRFGGQRRVVRPTAELLPRIC